MLRLKKQLLFSTIIAFFLSSQGALALTCYSVKGIIIKFLDEHYESKEFDENFSKKVLSEYIDNLDVGKAIYLEKEKQELINKYYKVLRQQIIESDCSAIKIIFDDFSKRLKKRYEGVKDYFRKKFDFTKDEYFDLNRSKKGYLKTEKDLNDYWRKRLKLELMRREENPNGKKNVDHKQKIINRYRRFYKQHVKSSEYAPFEVFLDSVGEVLGPHSNHLSQREMKDFELASKLSFEGIGAVLMSEGGLVVVKKIIVGGPAHKEGSLKVGDTIIGVDKIMDTDKSFIDIVDLDLREVVSYIRGEKGTTVRLKVLRDGKKIVISIVRDEIKLEDQAVKSTIFEIGPYKVGLIDLPSFYLDFRGRLLGREDYRSSSRDIRKAILELNQKNIDGLIVDLRSNGGGALDEAVDITGYFTGKGPVVLVKKRGQPYMPRIYEDVAIYKKPLLVLVDRLSASASEIFARAVKTYGRGIIVGDTTHGKGTVQNLIPIGREAIKVTIRKFYGPGGSSTQKRGVIPHIKFISAADIYEIGEKYYPGALPWSKIEAKPIKNFNMVDPYIAKLVDLSQKRTKKEGTFAELEKAILKTKNDPNWNKISLKKSDMKKDEKEKKLEAEKEKAAEEKKEKKKSTEFKPDLNEDPVLRETLMISGNYLDLIGNKKNQSYGIKGFVLKKKKPTDNKDVISPSIKTVR